jgi:uncharacterized protein
MDRIEALRDEVGGLLADHEVVFSYVFGSFARGDDRPDSDVDLAVAYRDDPGDEERFARTLDVGVALERQLGRAVDVVDLAAAPLRLQGRILTERIVLTGLDTPERVRFETSVFPRYIDADHHARRLDDEVIAAMAAGQR